MGDMMLEIHAIDFQSSQPNQLLQGSYHSTGAVPGPPPLPMTA